MQEGVIDTVVVSAFALHAALHALISFFVILQEEDPSINEVNCASDVGVALAAEPFEAQQLMMQHSGGQGAQLAGLQFCWADAFKAKPPNKIKIISTFFISIRILD